MQIQKSIIALTFMLFALTGTMIANNNKAFSSDKSRPVVQLNKAMQENLELTDDQFDLIKRLNRSYWFSRKDILKTADKVGQNTAVLACWNEWRLALLQSLTEAQMEEFIQWQTQVDLLGETPF